MFDAERFRVHPRTMLVVAAVSLFLLVGLVGFVLVNGSSSSPRLPASNAAAECETPTGPTARGYGETGTGVTPADPDCDRADDCESAAADGPTGRGYGESGAANVAPACEPCPPASSASAGPTGRGYGESGVGVLDDDCEPTAGASSDGGASSEVAPAAVGGSGPPSGPETSRSRPMTGGGGAHDGTVPGATGRAAPRSVDAADPTAGQPLADPLSAAAAVAQGSGVDGDRRNTALVVGGLVLLLVAVAFVLRRGRPGTAW